MHALWNMGFLGGGGGGRGRGGRGTLIRASGCNFPLFFWFTQLMCLLNILCKVLVVCSGPCWWRIVKGQWRSSVILTTAPSVLRDASVVFLVCVSAVASLQIG